MSSADDIQHFLVTYDPARNKATVREFGTDYDAAQDAYQEAEQQARGTDLDVPFVGRRRLSSRRCPERPMPEESPCQATFTAATALRPAREPITRCRRHERLT
jgi:hypothetical protein